MACSGLKMAKEAMLFQQEINNENSETRIALDLAMEFMEQVKEIKYYKNGVIKNLVLKIGIHYGRVIAGVNII